VPVPDGAAAHAGLPALDGAGPALSFFEFWPPWAFYAPVWAWIGLLALRYRGVRLPLLANPSFPAGGLVGEEKSTLFGLFSGNERYRLPHYVTITRDATPPGRQADHIAGTLSREGLAFPLVAKPDIGCRGLGVRPVRNRDALIDYLDSFPLGARFLLQRLDPARGEAGVFYVRRPGARRGQIVSLTLKYFPEVVGDGRSTLRELILADPRAGQLSHLYLGRFADRLETIPAAGERQRLVFAGSHSQGAIFRNGNAYITEAMRARFDAIADGIEEFHFGRFDVRFSDFEAFRRGEGFSVIEFNGAGAESTHIWDSRTGLIEAWRALFVQFHWLFRIGAANRARGFRPESWGEFLMRWRRERMLRAAYPPTA
jgi:hypothetical protein